MSRHLLSFGHGYSAQALARLLIPNGWTITGTTRDTDKASALAETGITPLIWPGTDPERALDRATHLLISAGPNDAGDPVLRELAEQITDRRGQFEWVGYLSTTGVYGDHQGGWVDETTPLTPTTKRGQMRKEAESAWAALDLPLHIFRLAGIYGPGRGPFEKIRKGTARRIIKAGQVFSRIHVEDIAQILAASITQPNPGAIYNLCDDDPAPPQDVIAHAAELLGQLMPPAIAFEEAELTPMARSFYAESKRVRNDRIKTELGVTLRFPSYREGLRDILENVPNSDQIRDKP